MKSNQKIKHQDYDSRVEPPWVYQDNTKIPSALFRADDVLVIRKPSPKRKKDEKIAWI